MEERLKGLRTEWLLDERMASWIYFKRKIFSSVI